MDWPCYARMGLAEAVQLRTILVVDDDPQMLRLLRLVLNNPRWKLLEANSSESALSIAASPDGIDLLLTDVVLPGGNGVRLAARLKERHPHMQVLFMSGYGPEILRKYGASSATETFIEKPLDAMLLRERVYAALGEKP